MKLVAIRRVIDDYDIFHTPSDSLHIFDKLAIEESAVLAEKSLRSDPLRIKDIHQWNGVL